MNFIKRLNFKRYLPKTFFLRSLFILVSPIVLIYVISGYVFFHNHWNRISYLLAENIAGEISSLIYLAEHDQLSLAKKIARECYDLAFSTTQTFPEHSSWHSAFDSSITQYIPYDYRMHKTHRWLILWVKTPSNVYKLELPSKRLIPRTTRLFILWASGTAIVFLFIAIFIMRNQVRPLKRLVRWASELEKDQPVALSKIEGAQEIRKISTAIQVAVNKIRRNFNERNRMLLGISHDLRTPLTRIKLHLQLIPPSEDIDELKQDVEQMIAMISTYLTFAKQAQEARTPVLLKSLLQELNAPKDKLQIAIHIPENFSFYAQRIQFKRCLQNLMNNANKYARSCIRLSVFLKEKALVFLIEDDGPGIPAHLWQDVFDPFFRVDEGRTLMNENVGLGLSIVKSIVNDHGGHIWAEKSSLGGAAFHLIFPL